MNPEEKKFQNYSQASRLRQSKIPPSVRRARASAAAKAKWAAFTPEERKAHSLKMTQAKQFGKIKTNGESTS